VQLKGELHCAVVLLTKWKCRTATVWNRCTTSLAVWGPLADSFRRLYRQSWFSSITTSCGVTALHILHYVTLH